MIKEAENDENVSKSFLNVESLMDDLRK